jgi:NADPH2:quinone reductase
LIEPFRAFRIHSPAGGEDARLETITLDDLSDGDVVIRGEYSSINFKDALAGTGKGKILRTYPLVGGVDVAGTVVESSNPGIAVGTRVVVNGGQLSETRDGGFAEYVRVPADLAVPLPAEIDTRTAMGLGTAGYTAALAIHRMELNGQKPEIGPIAVTGATGGVGSLAIDMLSGLGYDVTAITSKKDAGDYLRGIGASDILNLKSMELGNRPLEKAVWGGAVDNIGGDVLGWLTRTVTNDGNIAAIGLAAGIKLETTVMPFILRGVNLLGINSVIVPREDRIAVWERIASDLRPRHLDQIATREVGLDDLAAQLPAYMDGTVIGRTIVRLQ